MKTSFQNGLYTVIRNPVTEQWVVLRRAVRHMVYRDHQMHYAVTYETLHKCGSRVAACNFVNRETRIVKD